MKLRKIELHFFYYVVISNQIRQDLKVTEEKLQIDLRGTNSFF
jgi:hypothetical protein